MNNHICELKIGYNFLNLLTVEKSKSVIDLLNLPVGDDSIMITK